VAAGPDAIIPPPTRPANEEADPIDVVNVVLVGFDDDLGEELGADEGFDVRLAPDIADAGLGSDVHAVVVDLRDGAPLEVLAGLRQRAPEAAVLVVTGPDREADGAVALHAGAEDHLVRGSIPEGLLPRAIRYAVAHRRLRRDLSTVDEVTGLPNLRGFAPIAEHHLRMADRARTPVVFLFVRLEGIEPGAEDADGPSPIAEAAEVLLDAVRGSDVPARIAEDTFAVLLTGDARGAESVVLSRLVEAIATHDAARATPRPLSLEVGSALYDPDEPATFTQILETAGRRLHAPKEPDPSGTP
jgi:diguanylate cyclase (GGDEF)-like protein